MAQPDGLESVTTQIEECGGVDKIENLQNHENEDIYKVKSTFHRIMDYFSIFLCYRNFLKIFFEFFLTSFFSSPTKSLSTISATRRTPSWSLARISSNTSSTPVNRKKTLNFRESEFFSPFRAKCRSHIILVLLLVNRRSTRGFERTPDPPFITTNPLLYNKSECVIFEWFLHSVCLKTVNLNIFFFTPYISLSIIHFFT